MALRLCSSFPHHFVPPPHRFNRPNRLCKLSAHNRILEPNESTKLLFTSAASSSLCPLEASKRCSFEGKLGKTTLFCPHYTCATAPVSLVVDVKERLEKDYHNLRVGKCGRDDENMILWFLKDRKFSVEDAVSKLAKAIKWREEFCVSELSEESVRSVAETGKAYVHDFLDIYDRPVLIVMASKHLPAKHNPSEDEKLCVFLIEKALTKLPAGRDEILGIFDLRGFGTENADFRFFMFVFDIFYNYYPRRLGQVLFVNAPFVFKPIWQVAKPLLKSYASLVRFCSVEDVKNEYFTESTLPAIFRD